MGIRKYRPLFEVLLLALPIYIVHKIIFSFSKPIPYETFYYSLEQLYGFFLIASILIVFVLIKIKERNLDHVGYSFLLATSIKMVLAYIVLRPILNIPGENHNPEKINFFVIFMLFLTTETIIAIRLLNNNQ